MDKQIFTIGHSTRSIEEFTGILSSFKIECLADVRSYPGSKKFPQFNKEELSHSLQLVKINYIHIKELGGRRKVNPQSTNTAWKNKSFRGYADFMATDEFKKGIEILTSTAGVSKTAFMCSEAVWWRCHRSMISDYLKSAGWKVIHILDKNKSEEHPYTKPAKIINGKLVYGAEDDSLNLFN